MKKSLLVFILSLLLAVASFAGCNAGGAQGGPDYFPEYKPQDSPVEVIELPTGDGIVLDGVLDEEVYNALTWIDLTTASREGEGLGTLEIQVKATVFYGQKGIYLIYEVNNTPVYIDPTGKRTLYNDSGIQAYLGFAGENNVDHNYQIAFTSDGRISSDAWMPNSYFASYLKGAVSRTSIIGGEINTPDATGYIIESYIPWTAFKLQDAIPSVTYLDVAVVANQSATDSGRTGWESLGSSHKSGWRWGKPSTWWVWGNTGLGYSNLNLVVEEHDQEKGSVCFASDNYMAGDDVVINVAPSDGYIVKSVVVNGKEQARNIANGSIVLSNYTDTLDVKVSAEFIEAPELYTVSGTLSTDILTTDGEEWLLPEGFNVSFDHELMISTTSVGANGCYTISLPEGENVLNVNGFEKVVIDVKAGGGTHDIALKAKMFDDSLSGYVLDEAGTGIVFTSSSDGVPGSEIRLPVLEEFVISFRATGLMEGKSWPNCGFLWYDELGDTIGWFQIMHNGKGTASYLKFLGRGTSAIGQKQFPAISADRTAISVVENGAARYDTGIALAHKYNAETNVTSVDVYYTLYGENVYYYGYTVTLDGKVDSLHPECYQGIAFEKVTYAVGSIQNAVISTTVENGEMGLVEVPESIAIGSDLVIKVAPNAEDANGFYAISRLLVNGEDRLADLDENGVLTIAGYANLNAEVVVGFTKATPIESVTATVKLHKDGKIITAPEGSEIVISGLGKTYKATANANGEVTFENVYGGTNFAINANGYIAQAIDLIGADLVELGEITLEYNLLSAYDNTKPDLSKQNDGVLPATGRHYYAKFNQSFGDFVASAFIKNHPAGGRLGFGIVVNGYYYDLHVVGGSNNDIGVQDADFNNLGATAFLPAWNWFSVPVELQAKIMGDEGATYSLVRSGRYVYVYIDNALIKALDMGADFADKQAELYIRNWDNVDVFFNVQGEDAVKEFLKVTVNTEVNDSAMGSLTVAGEYIVGEDVVINVTANEGYKLLSLTVNGEDRITSVVDGVLTLTANNVQVVNVVATFEEKPTVFYTVSGVAQATAGASDAWIVPEGTVLNFGGGYTAIVGANGEYSIELPEGEHSVKADGYFESASFEVTENAIIDITLEWDLTKNNVYPYDSATHTITQPGSKAGVERIALANTNEFTIGLSLTSKAAITESKNRQYILAFPRVAGTDDGDNKEGQFKLHVSPSGDWAVLKLNVGGDKEVSVAQWKTIENIDGVDYCIVRVDVLLVYSNGVIKLYYGKQGSGKYVHAYTSGNFVPAEAKFWSWDEWANGQTDAVISHYPYAVTNVEVQTSVNDSAMGSLTVEGDGVNSDIVLNAVPADGHVLASLIVNGKEVTATVVDGKYTIAKGSVLGIVNAEATFEEKAEANLSATVKLHKFGEPGNYADSAEITLTGANGTYTATVVDGAIAIQNVVKGEYTVSAEGYISQTVTFDGSALDLTLEYNLLSAYGNTKPDLTTQNDGVLLATGTHYFAKFNQSFGDFVASAFIKNHPASGRLGFGIVVNGYYYDLHVIGGSNNDIGVQDAEFNDLGATAFLPAWNWFSLPVDLQAKMMGDEGATYSLVRSGRYVYVYIDSTLIKTLDMGADFADKQADIVIRNWDNTNVYFNIRGAEAVKDYIDVTVNTQVNDSAMGSVTVAGEYVVGNNVVLNVTANEGYQLASLTVNGVEKASEVVNGVLTIAGNTASVLNVVATFEEKPAELFAVSGVATATAGASEEWFVPQGTVLSFGGYTATVGANGEYSVELPAGEHEVSANGYTCANAISVADASVTANLKLTFNMFNNPSALTVSADGKTASFTKADTKDALNLPRYDEFTYGFEFSTEWTSFAWESVETNFANGTSSVSAVILMQGTTKGANNTIYIKNNIKIDGSNKQITLNAEEKAAAYEYDAENVVGKLNLKVKFVVIGNVYSIYYALPGSNYYKLGMTQTMANSVTSATLVAWTDYKATLSSIYALPYAEKPEVSVSVNDSAMGSLTAEGDGANSDIVLNAVPADGYVLESLVVNGKNVTSSVVDGKYAIAKRSFLGLATVEANFKEKAEANLSATVKLHKFGEQGNYANANGAVITLTGAGGTYTATVADETIAIENVVKGEYVVSAEGYISQNIAFDGSALDLTLEYNLLSKCANDNADLSMQNEGILPANGKSPSYVMFNQTYGDFVLSAFVKNHPSGGRMGFGIVLGDKFYTFQLVGNTKPCIQHASTAGFLKNNYTPFIAGDWKWLVDLPEEAKTVMGDQGGYYRVIRSGGKVFLYIDDVLLYSHDISADYADKQAQLYIKNWDKTQVNFNIEGAEAVKNYIGVTVNTQVNDSAMGSVTAAGEYVVGNNVALNVTANEGYQLASLTINGADYTSSMVDGVLTISGNTARVLNVVATFEEKPAELFVVSGVATATAGASEEWFVPEGTVLSFGGYTATVGANGEYSVELPAGEHEVSANGYTCANAISVADASVTANLKLTFNMFNNPSALTVSADGKTASFTKADTKDALNLPRYDEFTYGFEFSTEWTSFAWESVETNFANGTSSVSAVILMQGTTKGANNTIYIKNNIKIDGSNKQITLNAEEKAAAYEYDAENVVGKLNLKVKFVVIGNVYSIYYALPGSNYYKLGMTQTMANSVTSATLVAWTDYKATLSSIYALPYAEKPEVSVSVNDSAMGSLTAEGDGANSDIVLNAVPAEGYVLESLVVNGKNVTASVVDGKYTVAKGSFLGELTAEATFDVAPAEVYTLSGKMTGTSAESEAWNLPKGQVVTFTSAETTLSTTIGENGEYSIELPAGEYTLSVKEENASYKGADLTAVIVDADVQKDFALTLNFINLAEVAEITASEKEYSYVTPSHDFTLTFHVETHLTSTSDWALADFIIHKEGWGGKAAVIQFMRNNSTGATIYIKDSLSGTAHNWTGDKRALVSNYTTVSDIATEGRIIFDVKVEAQGTSMKISYKTIGATDWIVLKEYTASYKSHWIQFRSNGAGTAYYSNVTYMPYVVA